MTLPRRWRWALAGLQLTSRLRRLDPPHDVKRFVVVASPRSGSTWLIDLLDSHPQICCFSEVFAHEHYGRPPDGGNPHVTTWDSYAAPRISRLGRRQRLRLYFRYLDEQVFTPDHGAPWVGFKLMYHQLQRGFGLPAYLKIRGVSLVHLLRRNHLDVILSDEAQKVRKYYHAQQGSDVAPVRVQLEAATLLHRLAGRDGQIAAQRRCFGQLGLPYHEVAYEDLLSDRDGQLDQALEFLGLPPGAGQLHSELQRLSPSDRRQTIANYDEIERTLRGTPFESLLTS